MLFGVGGGNLTERFLNSKHCAEKQCHYILPSRNVGDGILAAEVEPMGSGHTDNDVRFVASNWHKLQGLHEDTQINLTSLMIWPRMEDLMDYSTAEEWAWSQHK